MSKPDIYDSVLDSLPIEVRFKFPAIVTYKSAVDKSLARLFPILISGGFGPEQISQMLRVLHFQR